MNLNSNQLQNHPKFITVHGRWAAHTIHEQGTMDQGSVVKMDEKIINTI